MTQAGAVIGTQQISLLPVTTEEFQELAENPGFADRLERRARERALLFQKQTASREIPPGELYEIYLRMEREDSFRRLPMSLEAIWDALSRSEYLREVGCNQIIEPEKRVLKLSNISGVLEGSALTTSRETFDQGTADLEGRLHFATYGDPVFEAILDKIASFDLPGCIRRLEAQMPGFHATAVGYAVATFDQEGNPICRLLTSYDDIAGLVIDETRELSDDDTTPALRLLEDLTFEEFRHHVAIPSIEAENVRAARSQLLLNYLTIVGLIRGRQRLGAGDPLFWREIDAVEEDYKDRESLRIRNIPADIASRCSGALFDVHLPEMGEEAYIDTPRPLLRAAIDAACRVADSMKVKRSELATDDVLARIERVMQQLVT